MKTKIGLIGEDPNDTLSIQNLLLQKYPDLFQFKQLIKNKRGYQLNNSRTDAALKVEFDYCREIIHLHGKMKGRHPAKNVNGSLSVFLIFNLFFVHSKEYISEILISIAVPEV